MIEIGEKNTFVFNPKFNKGEWRTEQLRNIDLKVGISLDFQFNMPSEKIVHVTLLKSAYLLAFEKFGHGFILNEKYNTIRCQIASPEKEILTPIGMMIKKNLTTPDGLYACMTPFGVKAILVIYSMKSKEEVYKACVFLPPHSMEASKFYQKFSELMSQVYTIDVSERFRDLDYLSNPSYSFVFMNGF